MANPHIVPCTFEQLYLVPASGYHFEPSKAKVVPIMPSAVQPTLVNNPTVQLQGKLPVKDGQKTAVTVLVILSVGLLTVGCFAYYKHKQDKKNKG